MIAHLRQINLEAKELGGGFLSGNVMQIVISEDVVFQAVLEAQDLTFDLYNIRQE